ncbi:MAG: methylmalonyl Co-A mutase-associated GTPase MeaB [Caldilineaceae bacterium]|nr:methylmalonyl Co-A mutase-associated GTPase MeaB [Caldilineaceae bacterium]MCY4115731.1 methylmalonyl Co-A mutase-associated GTPase MeaB [Caldilineaceae bacterium]MDE0069036.1 methylmalonyl Co-A mutase-associated GTPase MeaB [Caldilineaceae bacterium]
MPKRISTRQLIDGLLNGERLALARAISRVEDEAEDAAQIVQAAFAHTGKAHLVGITGAPGTGKSTLVSALAECYRESGLTVGVLAVDPTSPFSGGALLGDRVRMTGHSGDEGVFIRSMATRSGGGGLAKASAEALLLFDAAGFDRVLVETVGAGQAEVEIAAVADTVVVVEAPGMGDEVQAIKAGLLEIADVFAVNKADRKGADRTAAALEMMLEAGGGAGQTVMHHGQLMEAGGVVSDDSGEGWSIPVLKTVAVSGGGVVRLREALEAHRAWLQESGALAERERRRLARMLQCLVDAEVRARLASAVPPEYRQELVERMLRREVDPYCAAADVVGKMSGPT